jgi:hypothetical protein
MDAVYKAIRDLDPDDQKAALKVVNLMRQFKTTHHSIEVKSMKEKGRHMDWAVYTTTRQMN